MPRREITVPTRSSVQFGSFTFPVAILFARLKLIYASSMYMMPKAIDANHLHLPHKSISPMRRERIKVVSGMIIHMTPKA